MDGDFGWGCLAEIEGLCEDEERIEDYGGDKECLHILKNKDMDIR